MEMGKRSWDLWIEEALSKIESLKMFLALRPMLLPLPTDLKLQQAGHDDEAHTLPPNEDECEIFQGVQPWDRLSVQISISQTFFQRLLNGDDETSKYERDDDDDQVISQNQKQYKKLILFAGNDFLALSRHPSVAKAIIKVNVK